MVDGLTITRSASQKVQLAHFTNVMTQIDEMPMKYFCIFYQRYMTMRSPFVGQVEDKLENDPSSAAVS